MVRPREEDYQEILASNRIKIIGKIDLHQLGGAGNEHLDFSLNFLARNLSPSCPGENLMIVTVIEQDGIWTRSDLLGDGPENFLSFV